MDLTNFKKLEQSEYDALTPKDQALYELKLEAFNKAAREKEISEVATKLVADKLAEKEAETAEKINAAVQVVKDEYDAKIEKAQAEMQRAKLAQNEMRGIKTMQDEIMEKLSTPEGESMMKSFLAGDRRKLSADLESKAVVKPSGSTGSGVAPEFASIVGPGHDSFHARNLLPVFPTVSDLIKYVQFTTDPLADGFDTVAEGAQKPSLGYIPTVKDAPVRKIAGLLDVSDEFNDDVVGARAFWAYELPQAYLDAEDAQIYKGSGTSQDLLGLWTQAANQSLPQGSVSSASNVIDRLVAASTEVRKLKRNSTAYVVSPVAYQEILINKDLEGAYTYPIHFGADNILRIGDIPVLWSNVFDDDEGLVGDFARGAAIYQRTAMQLRYFEENKDNVEKNIVTIRLEGRIALPIYYPESFKKLDLFVPPTPTA